MNYEYRFVKINIHGQYQYKYNGLEILSLKSYEEAIQYMDENREKMAGYRIEKIDIDVEKERVRNELYRNIRL